MRDDYEMKPTHGHHSFHHRQHPAAECIDGTGTAVGKADLPSNMRVNGGYPVPSPRSISFNVSAKHL